MADLDTRSRRSHRCHDEQLCRTSIGHGRGVPHPYHKRQRWLFEQVDQALNVIAQGPLRIELDNGGLRPTSGGFGDRLFHEPDSGLIQGTGHHYDIEWGSLLRNRSRHEGQDGQQGQEE